MMKLLVGLLVVAACGAPQNGDPRGRARAEVERVVRGQVDAYARAETDRFGASLAADVVFVAHHARELYVGREDIITQTRVNDTLAQQFKLVASARWERLDSGVSADGDVAWAAGRFVFDTVVAGDRMPLEMRASEVLVRSDEGWAAVAAHYSYPVAHEDAVDGAAGGRWTQPAPVPDIVDDDADDLANRIAKDLRSPDALSAAIGEDTIYVGPGEDDYLVGASAAARIEQRYVGFAREGKNRVALAPGGSVGWTITNVDVSAAYRDAVVTMPMRALLVYERRGDVWTLVQVHFSQGLKQPG
jgi:hypothetical protein